MRTFYIIQACMWGVIGLVNLSCPGKISKFSYFVAWSLLELMWVIAAVNAGGVV